MRTLFSFVGPAFLIISVGCNTQLATDARNDPNSEPSTITNTEPAEAVAAAARTEDSDTELNANGDAENSEPGILALGGRGGMGQGPGRGAGLGRGPGANGGMREDMTTLHAMFAGRDRIRREITILPDGAEAVTESDDGTIAGLIQLHVPAMEGRVLEDNPLPPMTFHPVFVELIKHSSEYELTYEETEKGVKVKYTSDDPYVVMLVQEHAKLVSRFIRNGMEEIHKPYSLPKLDKKSENLGASR